MSVSGWVLALLLCSCLQDVSLAKAADERVFFNGKIFTGELDHPYAEMVAIRGDTFTLLDRDVLTVTTEELRDTRVLWTVVRGKTVYHARP